MGKVRNDDPKKLTDFKLLSFDVYSTLINEHGTISDFFLPKDDFPSTSLKPNTLFN